MKGYHSDIEKETLANSNFRKVLYTAKNLQLVLMSLKPKEEIGMEIHQNDQFFRIEQGQGKVIIDDTEYTVDNGDVMIVPAGSKHNVINISDTVDLKLYTIYAPPHHKDKIIRATKQEAMANEEEYDGVTSE